MTSDSPTTLPPVEPPLPTPDERAARGRSAREAVPPSSHGRWSPPDGRGDPIAILEAQAARRTPELVPIRHGRMMQSPFAFYRGAAAVMAADLAPTPRSGLDAQLDGDAHLVNYGFFETPERTHVFDINDFDETSPGPFEWDLKRLVASIAVAGRDLGFGAGKRRAACLAAAAEYRERMAGYAEASNLEVWYERVDPAVIRDRLEEAVSEKEAKQLARGVAKGLRRNHLTAFEKLIEPTVDGARFVSKPPLLVPIEELLDGDGRRRYPEVMTEFLSRYRESLRPDRQVLLSEYRFVHMARKVVGVGSVATRAWVVLMLGRDDGDPLILQLKEAQASVLEPYATPYAGEQGRRVVEGQRLMQAASDPLLGWYHLTAFDGQEHDFYVRQLWDGKASVDLTLLSEKGLSAYASVCGWALAKAHARSGDRIAIAAYLDDGEEFDSALADFGEAYADLTEEDHARLAEAVESGRLRAVEEED